jgi:hypothetical protein
MIFSILSSLQSGRTTLSGEELEKRTRNELKIGNLHQFMWFYLAIQLVPSISLLIIPEMARTKTLPQAKVAVLVFC